MISVLKQFTNFLDILLLRSKLKIWSAAQLLTIMNSAKALPEPEKTLNFNFYFVPLKFLYKPDVGIAPAPAWHEEKNGSHAYKHIKYGIRMLAGCVVKWQVYFGIHCFYFHNCCRTTIKYAKCDQFESLFPVGGLMMIMIVMILAFLE